jgi:phosphoribosyl-ATP pyrophosphohydrolase
MTETLERITATINERKGADPEKSYVAKLFAKGDDAMLKKIGEEATEVVLAAKSGEKLQLVNETADLWFHCLIVLARHGLGPADVLAEMHRREGISGIDEKAARKKR